MKLRTAPERLALIVAMALVSALLTLIAAATIALADEPAAPAAQPRLEVGVQISANPKLPDYLTATMRDASGQPLSGRAVSFSIATKFLGQKWIQLGEATTDASGVARLTVSLEDRQYQVRVRFVDGNGTVVAEATNEVAGPRGVRQALLEVSSPLQGFAFWMPRLIGAAVALVWLVLAGVAVLSVRRIRQGRAVVDGR
jgi:hypothetical protein